MCARHVICRFITTLTYNVIDSNLRLMHGARELCRDDDMFNYLLEISTPRRNFNERVCSSADPECGCGTTTGRLKDVERGIGHASAGMVRDGKRGSDVGVLTTAGKVKVKGQWRECAFVYVEWESCQKFHGRAHGVTDKSING